MSTWIFLRGLTRETRHWSGFPATFRGTVNDARVVCIDLPGNGCEHHLSSPLRVEEMAAWCRATTLARGINPPYRLLAMSLGAMVAVAWTHAYPADVAGCVLINTSLRPFNPFYRRLRPGNYATLLKLLLPGTSDEAWERTVLRITSSHPDEQEQLIAAWLAWRRERPVSRINALRQLCAALSYRAPTAKPQCPTLILASRGDVLVNPSCSRQIAHLWQASYCEHPCAGHDIPLDDGTWVAEQVAQWLRFAIDSQDAS